MTERLAPKKDTPEAQKLIDRYLKGEVDVLWEEFGYANRHSFMTSMRNRYGVKLGDIPIEVKDSPPVPQPEPYPNLKIRPWPTSRDRDKEDIAIDRADAHTGKKTQDYSIPVYQARTDYLLGKVMRIIERHRPIGTCHINYLGDNVQGENVYQGSNVDDTECGAYEQIFSYAVPTEARFLTSIAQGVEKVEVHCVAGNHGKMNREATPRTNWDNFFYQALSKALSNQKNIAFDLPDTFYKVVNILGFRFFLFHGHQVNATMGIPHYGIKRKCQEWFAYVNSVHYFKCGHFHTTGKTQINSEADCQYCPPLITGDEWALQIVGSATRPIQLCYGIHKKMGRSFQYELYTDNSYLPQPKGTM